jgi:calcineurin-like phosphoesterase family protein
MSSNTFLIADTHFGHANICKFLTYNGEKTRPWDDVNEMDEALISNWNSVVKPKDRVNLLGDVVINRRCISTLNRLNGRIRLISGNHDIFKAKEYLPFVDDIKAYWPIDGCIMSHIPIHPNCLSRWKANIHGHLHTTNIEYPDGTPDPRYICVSCEQINFTPISIEDLKKKHGL